MWLHLGTGQQLSSPVAPKPGFPPGPSGNKSWFEMQITRPLHRWGGSLALTWACLLQEPGGGGARGAAASGPWGEADRMPPCQGDS